MQKNNFEDYIKKIYNSDIKHSVITILGHVNHGKTSILNRIISKSYIESNNITQHIKYFYIKFKNKIFTFIDTPGHEDFNKIRSLSIKITDIILLVISIDDGINKQTIECINYIKKNNIKTIIIINKIDKNINSNKILNELSNYNIVSEEWGGEYKFIYTSAKKNIGIDEIINNISQNTIKTFNFKNFKNDNISNGIIIESYIDKKEGIKTVLIVKNGIFKVGNYISTNLEKNKKIKSIYSMNENIKFSIPSMPIEIIGLSKIHRSGNIIYSYERKKIYNNIIFNKVINNRKKINNYDNTLNFNKNENKLNIILKTDVTGSCEVILKILNNINNNENIDINIIYYNIGDLNLNDINKAIISKSIIIGFNIKLNNKLYKMIKDNNIIFNNYKIIYDLTKDIKNIISNYKNKIKNKNIKGLAIVINVFKLSNIKIAGCKVNNGIININNDVNIFRKNIKIFEDKIKSIKIFNKNVIEVKNNNEFGLIFKNFNDIKINDIIKFY